MFEAGHDMFHSNNTDEKNVASSTVDRCINVELANAFGVPELAPFGCDNDLAG